MHLKLDRDAEDETSRLCSTQLNPDTRPLQQYMSVVTAAQMDNDMQEPGRAGGNSGE